MRTKTVKRHYCDYCNKGGFTIPGMNYHESICFRNPHRDCPVCADEETDVAKNVALLEKLDRNPYRLLVELCCPACVSAAIAQLKINLGEEHIEFDYKKEIEEYEKSLNEFEAEDEAEISIQA